MTGQITPAERAALPVARAALEGRASAYGPADAIVVALGSAGLLMSPETAAELARLHEERGQLDARIATLAPYEQLHVQTCESRQHRPWFADTAGTVPCPWCRIAELEESGPAPVYRAARHGTELGTYATVDGAGTACEAAVRDGQPGAVCEWTAGEAPGVIELTASAHGGSWATGYTVTTVTVLPDSAPAAEDVTA